MEKILQETGRVGAFGLLRFKDKIRFDLAGVQGTSDCGRKRFNPLFSSIFLSVQIGHSELNSEWPQ
jgi:hypothetical protein